MVLCKALAINAVATKIPFPTTLSIVYAYPARVTENNFCVISVDTGRGFAYIRVVESNEHHEDREMCQTTTKTTRSCKWIGTDTKWNLENGRCGMLRVEISGVASFYYVTLVDGEVWVRKESCDHSEPQESYRVSLGEWPSCTCKDHMIRRRGRSDCKHIAFTRAAIKAIGIGIEI